jgi:ketosteroid isomerase-like protein
MIALVLAKASRDTGPAMSQENVELVQRVTTAWERGDVSALIDALDPAMVTRRLPPLPDPGQWDGVEGLFDVAADWGEAFSEWEMHFEEFVDAGDAVVVRVRQEAQGDHAGVPVSGVFWFVYAVRDGKVVGIDMYDRREQALEAVGLRE